MMRFWLVFFTLLPTLSYAQLLHFTGYAHDLDSKALLYSEEHRVTLSQDEEYLWSEVVYRDATGEVIARKQLDYSTYPLQPNLIFRDERMQQEVKASRQVGEITLQVSRAGQSQLSEKLSAENELQVVVDAGFDRLVEKHWAELLEGRVKRFEFLALTRGTLVTFELRMTAMTESQVQLQIAPKSWLIGLLMDPISLRYDKASRLLMDYQGVTNIAEQRGERVLEDNYLANIRYEYHAVPASLLDSGIKLTEVP